MYLVLKGKLVGSSHVWDPHENLKEEKRNILLKVRNEQR